MTYHGPDHAKQATSYSRTASAATRRAERDAATAAKFYALAADQRRRAARLATQSWAYSTPGYTPATVEDEARCWAKTGDVMLRASFHATKMAAHYRRLAASYRGMAKRQAPVPDYAAIS